jgi:hypothetical protein
MPTERPHAPFPGPVASWLFFLAGAALLLAMVIIPAQADLAEARWQRDRAMAREAYELERLRRHEAYLDALDVAEPRLVRSLAASQLNLVPTDRGVLLPPDLAHDIDILGPLEPPTWTEPAAPRPVSRLARWSADRSTRLWLIAGAMLCLFIGLLPGASARRPGRFFLTAARRPTPYAPES